jgi:hypothetical protein
MVEYAVMLGGLLGLGAGSLFNFDSVWGISSIFIAAAGLLIFGYLIKGIWGAIIVFLVGTVLFLYLRDFLPF